jgi:ArsR family transcriptional regulator, lead/cadmium/zinc/bismuth-responsive transcriptional repressor
MVGLVVERDAVCDGDASEGCSMPPVQLLDEATAGRLATTFSVLSDPTRIRIIGALAEGERCVHELADALGLTHSAVSHQLAMLRDMQLVTYTKEGRHVYYALGDAHILDLFQQGLAHVMHTETSSLQRS